MLKLKNADGEVLMRLTDEGTEEFENKKFEENYKQAGKQLNEKQSKKEAE